MHSKFKNTCTECVLWLYSVMLSLDVGWVMRVCYHRSHVLHLLVGVNKARFVVALLAGDVRSVRDVTVTVVNHLLARRLHAHVDL